jgi:hypothetical protein
MNVVRWMQVGLAVAGHGLPCHEPMKLVSAFEPPWAGIWTKDSPRGLWFARACTPCHDTLRRRGERERDLDREYDRFLLSLY